MPRKDRWTLTSVQRLTLIAIVILPALAFGLFQTTRAKTAKTSNAKSIGARTMTPPVQAGKTYLPTRQPVMVFSPINVAEVAREEALAPSQPAPAEIKSINPPAAPPDRHFGVPVVHADQNSPQAPPPSPTGPSPGPSQTFPGEFLSGTTIPPDTMGAVGTTHIVTPTNNMIRMQDRNGVQLSRITISAFWTGVTLEGGAAVSAFDTKVYFDRFNNRFFMISSANGQTLSSAVLFAATATADPTGTWFRYAIDADAAANPGGGKWIDYPSVGFNKNWIVINENVFNYGSAGTGYFGPYIYAIDKALLYTGPVSITVPLFQADFNATCLTSATPETELACGFTMVPATTEDNTTNTEYLVEDWDATLAQLRLAKITGTAAAPVLTVATQFPQSPNSWRFNAVRIGTTGGYAPQKQQSAYLTSGARIMTNDSRIQNSVFRNGSLWTTHTVMLSTVPQPAGTDVGGAGNPANPDNHSGVQWWQIDPTIETGLSTPPLQRARIEDATADNCHNGTGGTVATPPCSGSTLNQHGQFYGFPSISVNQNNDVLIGFTQFSNLTYASGGYVFRASTDPVNTTRDFAVFRPGQANYNIGSGSGASRQDRWGDYSATQTDPLNDTDFWTIQEYAGAQRDFGIGIAGPWETWWALVKPSTPAPSLSGNLIISEFRLRGPQGVNDEFVELYNPGSSAVIVNTTDNSDGWALAYSTTSGVVSGIAVIPNGTVIPAKGHFLIARNQDSANGPTLVYSLNSYPGQTNPSTLVRGAGSDTGYAVELADNGGLALFKTSTVANFTAPNRMDSVGFASTPVGLFKEGTGIPDISVAGIQQTIFRNSASGEPQDIGDNAADFLFADPAGTLTAAGQRLGAPGPENLDSPIHNTTGTMGLPVFDGSVSAATAPNFVFDPTPVTNGTAGTITVRRRLVNNTGASISRVRLRFVDITTFPPPSVTVADLRVLSSSNLTVETPPAQALGGGLNSSVAPLVVTFAAPLANGANIPIDFVFGLMQTGCFHFIVIAEALPGGASAVFGFGGTAGSGTCAPTAAPATISGTVTTPDGAPLAGVTMNLSGARSARAVTDSNGNYRFTNTDTDNFYTVTPALTNYHFNPPDRSFSLLANKTDAVFTATRDAVIGGNVIDSAGFFVRQHYLDFLGREPDESGFNFWSDQILSCGSDTACAERRTINVSAAYFLSIEFQETGGLVDGLYRASYNRRPLFAEFMPDTATVAQDVIVGSSDWAQRLAANKQAFVDAWVQRAAFQAAYGGLTNEGYVDTLIGHTGVSFSQSERDALVNGVNNGTSTRAEVLRQIAENDGFVSAKRNATFVMMQYFGYLRRDPDESGYQFWLNKLNQFGGNFEQAEMVKAFIVSGEYRARFAQ
jgi:hypothetical protein